MKRIILFSALVVTALIGKAQSSYGKQVTISFIPPILGSVIMSNAAQGSIEAAEIEALMRR